MNKSGIAALVVMAAIVTPIILGYALSFEEEERIGWESTDSANLSDLILNSETAYHSVSAVPLNNAELISGGALVAPNYVAVGPNVSSLPEYTTTSESINNVTESFIMSGVGVISTSSNSVGAIHITPTTSNPYRVGANNLAFTGEISIFNLEGLWYQVEETATSAQYTNIVMDNSGNIPTDAGGYGVIYTLYKYVALPAVDWSFDINGTASVRVVHDSTEEIIDLATTMFRVGNVVSGRGPSGGFSFNNVDSVEVAAPNGSVAGTISRVDVISGSYADPSQGWRKPNTSPSEFWINGHLNKEVRMFISLEAGEYVTFRSWVNSYTYGPATTISRTGTATYVSSSTFQNLGNYSKLQVNIRSDGYDIIGIADWPAMYAQASPINTYSVSFDSIGDFSRIELLGPGTVEYRVDYATIVAGHFPIAEDYSLEMGEYWPGSSWTIDFTTIGIYGDSIGFGGNTYPVDNGQIVVSRGDSELAVSLRDAIFSATFNGTNWTYAINNLEQTTASGNLPLIFNGVWSLTMQGYKMEQVTESVMVWVPGEFSLDSSGFVVAGLIGVLVAFVGIALYSRRSGGKVLWLLVICGAVSVIFISMI